MSKPYDSYTLGDHVKFSRRMRRRWVEGSSRVEWVPEDCAPEEGVYVGYRYKQNGRVTHYEYSEWKTLGTVLVALVALRPDRGPVPVDFDSLRRI